MRALWAFILVSAAGPLAADPILDWPVDCQPGTTCFIEDYIDHDPGPNARDYACGLNTRDDHKGTDIALFSFDAIEGEGVAVVAAAPGTVLRTRDGMADDRLMRGVTDDNACGNAVILAHADGWETYYCHLKNGSVVVKPGDLVQPGDPLGRVGLSGQTTHPHLHFGVFHNGRQIDPFQPVPTDSCDAPPQDTLWRTPVAYEKTLLRLAGFANTPPDYDALRAGTARIDTARPDEPLLVYAEAGFAQHGDVLTITATGPQGEVFRHSRVMKAPKASQLPFFGKRAPSGGWVPGEYLGQLTLTRQGKVVANRWAHVRVAAP